MNSVVWSNEPWTADGLPLNDYCVGIESISGDGMPDRVGSNVKVPYNPGRVWNPKTFDQQQRTLLAWISDMRGDGYIDAANVWQLAQMHENRENFLRVFAVTDRLLPITRQIHRMVGGVPTPVILNALAEPTGAVQMQTVENFYTLNYVSLDLDFPDPYWYGSNVGASAMAGGATVVINNPGTVPAENHILTFRGPLSNPVYANLTPTPDHSVQVALDIADGDSVTLDVGEFTARRTSDGANVIGAVSRTGGRRWMRFTPGDNSTRLTASSGTGRVDVDFTPPYLI